MQQGDFRTATAWMAQGYSVRRASSNMVFAYNPSDDCLVCRRSSEYEWWDPFSATIRMEDLYATDWQTHETESEWDGWLEGELSSDFVLPGDQ